MIKFRIFKTFNLFRILFLLFLMVSPVISNIIPEVTYYKNQINKPLEEKCIESKDNFYYRSLDGSCNWLVKGQHEIGMAGQPIDREFKQYSYADGISIPRVGPNPRDVSNAFFKREKIIPFNHTSILVGLIEFVIHDLVMTARDPTNIVTFPVPKCDYYFDPECVGNKSFSMWDSMNVPGTGTSIENPKEIINGATAWLDLSPLYGNSKETSIRLRSFVSGKLKVNHQSSGDYLPFNTMNLKMNSFGNPKELFAGGDPRTNQDWLTMGVHTLLLRNHNRLCDILKSKYPMWDDERLFQYARHLNIGNYFLVLASYQASYVAPGLSFPASDGVGFIREFYGKSFFQGLNNFYTYPWKVIMPNDVPVTGTHEMAIGYRFHDFIPDSIPVIDEKNNTILTINTADTTFNAKGFLSLGLESILRGMANQEIPGFHSGVAETYRNAKISYTIPQEDKYFDLIAWTIAQERSRGVPTYNEYFRKYTGAVPVKPKKTFEEFTSNPEFVKKLKELYATPDDVDYMVGLQLDETLYPGSIIPTSMMLSSLISLFTVAASDRFSPAYTMMLCVLGQKPWDCIPTTAFDEMIWKPVDFSFMGSYLGSKLAEWFPRARWYDNFWLEELDIKNAGKYAIWKLITKNTNIKCLQLDPLFPADPIKNPIVCEIPADSNAWMITSCVLISIGVLYLIKRLRRKNNRINKKKRYVRGYNVERVGFRFRQK
jgi:peroxidase